MRIVAAGVSGFLGTALRDVWARDGHQVVQLVRGEVSGPAQSSWNPSAGRVDAEVIASADAVVNLAGAPIARWPWTESYKRTLLQSRVSTTRTLATALVETGSSATWLNASGVAAYGDDRGAEVLTEESATGAGVLTDVVRQWEAATQPAQDAGVRVCLLRSGVVLDRRGGALRTMLLPFRLGAGARIGTGKQYFSVISLSDWLRASVHLLTHDDATGPYNLTGPQPPTNAEYTRALADTLHRPAALVVPARPLRLVLGDLSAELLGSLRVLPQRLLGAGFTFEHPDVRSAVGAALHPGS